MNKFKRELLDKTFQTFMEVGLGGENLDLIDDMVAKDAVGLGTTIDEKLFGVKELKDLLIRQKEQSAGMEMNWKITTLDIHISNDENNAIFTNELMLYVTVDGNTIEMYMRFSVVLEYIQDKWLVVHWHGSKPEHVASEKDTWGVQSWQEKAEALEKEVAARTADLVEKNRELEIGAALEKVRNRTLLMKVSTELNEVVAVFFQQLRTLNLLTSMARTYFCHINPDTAIAEVWMTHANGSVLQGSHKTPLNSSPSMVNYFEAWKRKEPVIVRSYTGDSLKEYLHFISSLPHVIVDKDYQQLLSLSLEKIVMTDANFLQGNIGVMTLEPLLPEALDILTRFAKVFEFTYTRFLDLQKAEVQAKEVQTELALERIRSLVTAMQESYDLLDIVVTMRTEFVKLGHEAHYFWHMRWLPERYDKAMTSGDGTKIGMVMTLPRHIHGDITDVATWEKSNEPTHVLAMDAETAVDYVHKMITLGDFERVDPQSPTLDDIRHIGGLTFVMARTTHGEIGFSLPGVVPDPSKDALDTLVRFAGVFDLAYKRFEDLKTSEKDLIEIKAAREKAEEALLELKTTQSQLVQQEKLASLGQLTAGIAHEIKNPLNFVNNFSELSLELIDEALDEIAKIKDNQYADETVDILTDVQSNLNKIYEHGTRANSIVNSMLQHSRGGTGKKELTDLNALVKEYVNLCFHGMRAGKNPINVDIVLDLDTKLGLVPLIREDFTRVVINLCNNAFDAVRQKTLQGPENYIPRIRVKTTFENDQVSLAIEDNGPGIPDDIKDKILQPFFTTKKGTEGTGLGLSITHDIVKAHGGGLKIETSINKGSSFIIKLNK